MDNDNKIKVSESNRHNEVLLFLNNELSKLHDENENDSYNLEREFEKTKKNRNKSVYIILIASFVFVFLLAGIITFTLTKSNNNLTISMNSFDDLNLKGLIDSVSSAQNNYDNAVKTKVRLEVNLASAIKAAETQRENDIFVLDSLKLKSKSEYKTRLDKIEKEYNETIAKAHEEYDPEIAAAEKEAELYQEQLTQFDAAKVQAAQEQQKALDSERELRLLEQKKITDKYDAQISQLENKITELTRKNTSDMHKALGEITDRYEEELRTLDPVIYDEQGNEIIIKANENGTTTFNAEEFALDNGIKNEAVTSAYKDYQALMEEYNYLEDKVKQVPYKNSVPKYLAAARQLVNKMGQTLANGSVELNNEYIKLENKNKKLQAEVENQKKLVEKEKQERAEDIQGIEATLESLLNTVKASGVILSANSADNIRVYIGSKYRELVTEEGIAAEVKGVKTVKGRIIKIDDNTFCFTSGVDKNGEPVEIDVTAILPGATVKITAK